ncbi:unnamed protein product [Coregonus sp. 'balchen']|nr:unnamed protein product [Coregonus sp. 'balchen']
MSRAQEKREKQERLGKKGEKDEAFWAPVRCGVCLTPVRCGVCLTPVRSEGSPDTASGDLASEDEYLDIPSISRQRAGTYECTAVNDIATDGRDVGVTLGQRGVLECEAEAVPEADFEWYRDDRRIFNGFDGMEIEDAGQLSKLTFFNVSEADYGNYTCIAINKLGSSNTSFVLYEGSHKSAKPILNTTNSSKCFVPSPPPSATTGPGAVQDGNSSSMGTHVHTYTCLLLTILLQFLLRF